MVFDGQTSDLDLTRSDSTIGLAIRENGVMTIHPVGVATGLVSIEVSNNNIDFFELDSSITGYDVNEPVTIDSCDWYYYRFVTHTVGTGNVYFKIVVK